MSIDVIGDMLTKIRNALPVKREYVEVRWSKMKEGIAKIMKDEGYITNYEIIEDSQNPNKKYLRIHLKYIGRDMQPAIKGIQRVSKPGKRYYVSVSKIPRIYNGLGVVIMTTSKGIITGKEARELNVGGEVIAYIW